MIVDEEIDILLDDLLELYGYDFSDYSKASLKRRIVRLYTLDKFYTFSDFRNKIRSDTNYIKRFIEEITVNVTDVNDTAPVITTTETPRPKPCPAQKSKPENGIFR